MQVHVMNCHYSIAPEEQKHKAGFFLRRRSIKNLCNYIYYKGKTGQDHAVAIGKIWVGLWDHREKKKKRESEAGPENKAVINTVLILTIKH